MNTRIRGFPPRIGTNPRVLILGSMPGIASLTANRYYAHPRNRFWTILGEWLGFDPSLDYASRVQALHRAGIAVWDVLAECEREGSLDAAIMRDSEHGNHPALNQSGECVHAATDACGHLGQGTAARTMNQYAPLTRRIPP